jgi:hypothetical protein
MNSTDHNPFSEHFSLLLDGKLSEERSRELSQQLASDPSLRRFYLEYIKIHTLLRGELEGRNLDGEGTDPADLIYLFSDDADSVPASAPQAPPRTQNSPSDAYRFSTPDRRRPSPRPKPSVFRIGRIFPIAAAVLIVVAAGFWAAQYLAGPTLPTLATVTNARNAFWETDDGQGGRNPVALTAGGLQLRAGQLELTFSDGTVATLDAPAHVNLASENHLHLTRGRVYVIAPDGASGFRVSTPSALAVDLGTEFGVTYSHNLVTEVHVFKGAVNLSTSNDFDPGTPDPDAESLELAAGHSGFVSWDAGPTPGRSADASLFVRSIEALDESQKHANTLESWHAYRDRLRNDPDLVAMYDFTRRESAPRVLFNLSSANGTRLNGRLGDDGLPLSFPRWTTGRFPGSQALLFTPAHKQFVGLPVDDALKLSGDMTAVWWMRPRNTFNQDFSMVILGCGAPRGADGRETLRDNHLYAHGLKMGKLRAFHESADGVNEECLSSSPIEPDRWTHVAIVRDTASKTYRIYINGGLADTKTYNANPQGGDAPTTQITLGRSGGAVLNHYDGKLDELLLYKRALTDLEVRSLYEHSRAGN